MLLRSLLVIAWCCLRRDDCTRFPVRLFLLHRVRSVAACIRSIELGIVYKRLRQETPLSF